MQTVQEKSAGLSSSPSKAYEDRTTVPQTVDRASAKHKSEFSFCKFLDQEKSGMPSPEKLIPQKEEQESYGTAKNSEE